MLFIDLMVFFFETLAIFILSISLPSTKQGGFSCFCSFRGEKGGEERFKTLILVLFVCRFSHHMVSLHIQCVCLTFCSQV